MGRGRPSKSLDEHKLAGTYRPGRHGNDSQSWEPTGEPSPPYELTEDAAELWEQLVPVLVQRGVATAVDSAELAAMCTFWRRFRQASRALDELTDCGDLKACRLLRQANIAFKAFSAIAAKFGLNPSDRSRLRLSPANNPKSALQEFINS
jgi:P27 family predicted phage terminase small subunit